MNNKQDVIAMDITIYSPSENCPNCGDWLDFSMDESQSCSCGVWEVTATADLTVVDEWEQEE